MSREKLALGAIALVVFSVLVVAQFGGCEVRVHLGSRPSAAADSAAVKP